MTRKNGPGRSYARPAPSPVIRLMGEGDDKGCWSKIVDGIVDAPTNAVA